MWLAYTLCPAPRQVPEEQHHPPHSPHRIEGKGNGIKTVIPNMSDIAKSLARPATYPTKFFGIELGAQVKCDAAADRYIVNGAHDAEKLATLLDSFITKFVLCPSCNNPETDLEFQGSGNSKDEVILRRCKACGAVHPCDKGHKLCTFIQRNPTEEMLGKGGKGAKKGAKARGAASPDGSDGGGGEGEAEGMGSDDEITRRIEREAAALRRRQGGDGEEEDDNDWAADTSEAAVAARMRELAVSGAVAKLMGGEDGEAEGGAGAAEDGDGDDPADHLAAWLADAPERHSDTEIRAKIKELGVRSDKALGVLACELFTDRILADRQIAAHQRLLAGLVKNEKCQRALLGGMERLLGVKHAAALLAKTPLVLKALYDAELVEEETLLAWAEKPGKKWVDRRVAKDVRAKAEPFIAWLRDAESGSSGSDEEEEEE